MSKFIQQNKPCVDYWFPDNDDDGFPSQFCVCITVCLWVGGVWVICSVAWFIWENARRCHMCKWSNQSHPPRFGDISQRETRRSKARNYFEYMNTPNTSTIHAQIGQCRFVSFVSNARKHLRSQCRMRFQLFLICHIELEWCLSDLYTQYTQWDA